MSRYPAPPSTSTTPALPPSDPPGGRWWSSQQSADYLGINVRTLRLHVAKGNLRCRRVGRLYKFEKETLDKFAQVIDNS
jgi:excisionase family DNA binding protein